MRDDDATPLWVLVVEDDPKEATLLAAAARHADREVSWRRVATLPGLLDSLAGRRWDAVLVDHAHAMPGWRAVVEIAAERSPLTPVIVVSAEGREDLAAGVLRAGAAEYIVKDELWRLAPALEREVGRAAARREARREHADYELLAGELNALLRQSSFFLWATDAQLRITRFWGPEAAPSYVGRMVGDIGLANSCEVVHAHRQALERRSPVVFEMADHDRIYRCEVDAGPLEGGGVGCVGVGVDITSQRETERALRDSEVRFRTIVETALDMFMIFDTDAKIVFANPAFERTLGYANAEFVGTPAFDYVHPDDIAKAREGVRNADSMEVVELRVRDKGGSWHLFESVVQRFRTTAVDGVLIAARDVTERRTLEAQLRRRASLELIGQLAGGVAHDFNNVLQVIQAYASLLIGRTNGDDDGAREGLRQILEATDRAGQLTGQLLAIGRRQVLAPKPVHLGEAVAGFEPLLRQALRPKVELRLELDDSPLVRCDPTQIERAILNLVINARDAIVDAGAISLRTGTVDLGADAAAALQPGVPPGRYGALCVADTGSGIPPEVMPRLFEAFFTTKGDLGNGLGLATVYGIVSQSGGGISVDTSPGAGTSFTIYLPLADAA